MPTKKGALWQKCDSYTKVSRKADSDQIPFAVWKTYTIQKAKYFSKLKTSAVHTDDYFSSGLQQPFKRLNIFLNRYPQLFKLHPIDLKHIT